MVGLSEQVQTFVRRLPEIRQQYGSAWAVQVQGKVEGAFTTFQEAAKFAMSNFAGEEFLIRHTDDEPETVPFVMVAN